jgi:GTPase SAR1 family protein
MSFSIKLLDSAAQNQASEELLLGRRELLDVINELRSLGLARVLDLPQLIVCGDQSSGKSSVLEAISRVRFPVDSGLCTLFATEVTLRRSPHESARVTIQPGPSRTTEAEKRKLSQFEARLSSTAELPRLIKEAKEWMGPQENGFNTGFTDDILRIEVSGPDQADLTLVDLPGLIHAKPEGGSGDEAEILTVSSIDT